MQHKCEGHGFYFDLCCSNQPAIYSILAMWWLGRRAMPWGSSGTRTRTVSKLRSFSASNSAPRGFTNCILFQGAACLARGILAMYKIFRFDEESDLFGRASVLGRDFFGTLN